MHSKMKQRSATSSNNNSFGNNSSSSSININNNSNFNGQQQLQALTTTAAIQQHQQQLQQQQQQQLSKSSQIVTEWEDGVIFDVDDPDFCSAAPTAAAAVVIDSCAAALRNLNFIVPTQATTTTATATATNMSSASVHAPQIADICSPLAHHNLGLSASLPDLVGSPLEINMDNVLTIEELRQHIGSCFTCGVSWTDDHVSLDCSECGGYSLERSCPLCDGQCGVQWKRDFAMSHACSKARWLGVCLSFPEAMQQLPNVTGNGATATSCAAAAANQLRLAQELCSRLEQLSTTSASTVANKITRL